MSHVLIRHYESLPQTHHHDLTDVLRNASYPALHSLTCCVAGQEAVLRGQVPSFYLKQLAQKLVLERLGTEIPLNNQIRVLHGDRNERGEPIEQD